jgi:hypothetical protein
VPVKVAPVVPTAPLVGETVSAAPTVKLVVEVAVFDEASVTVTVWEPAGSAGMVKATVDEPLVPVVAPEVIVAVVPPTLTVRAELAAKPWALMVVLVPTVPVVGLRPVAEAPTVKVVPEVALLVPSETTTLWEPAGSAGTVKVTVDEPLVPVVPPEVMVAEVPPTLTVRAELAAKPWALMVVLVPTVPVVGLRPVAEAVTVKEAEALWDPAVKVTVSAPAGACGTVKVEPEKVPVALVVVVPDKVTLAPLKVAVRVWLAGKFDPETDSEVPTAPVVGLSVMVGELIV